jgi:hypothetical protein
MAANWYKVAFDELEPVHVVKVLKNHVVVREEEVHFAATGATSRMVEHKYLKQDTHRSFFLTWAEAHAHLIKVLSEQVERATRELQEAQWSLEAARQLKMPKEEKDGR